MFRVQTESIAKNAFELESLLEDKRLRVDKLVKVRSLLAKLEFLSELPEKLARMIEREHYHDAVALYNKTIRVLTKHASVLSFRNIQLRTEQMMKDLRVMVMGLLEEKSLHMPKLTQYVATLRLMDAPSEIVMQKFLTAHEKRWKEYLIQTDNEIFGGLGQSHRIASGSAGSGVGGRGGGKAGGGKWTRPTIAHGRTIHKTIVTGLLEACKGFVEMFGSHTTIQQVHNASPQAIQSIWSQLQTLVTSVMDQYMDFMTALQITFFAEFRVFRQSNSVNLQRQFQQDMKWCEKREEVGVDWNRYSMDMAMWTNERDAFLTFMRQTITECSLADESMSECKRIAHELLGKDEGEVPVWSQRLCKRYWESVLSKELSYSLLQRCDIWVSSVEKTLPQFIRLCELWRNETLAANDFLIEKESGEERPGPGSTMRAMLHDRTDVLNAWKSMLVNAACVNFSSLAMEVRSVYEVLDCIVVGGGDGTSLGRVTLLSLLSTDTVQNDRYAVKLGSQIRDIRRLLVEYVSGLVCLVQRSSRFPERRTIATSDASDAHGLGTTVLHAQDTGGEWSASVYEEFSVEPLCTVHRAAAGATQVTTAAVTTDEDALFYSSICRKRKDKTEEEGDPAFVGSEAKSLFNAVPLMSLLGCAVLEQLSQRQWMDKLISALIDNAPERLSLAMDMERRSVESNSKQLLTLCSQRLLVHFCDHCNRYTQSLLRQHLISGELTESAFPLDRMLEQMHHQELPVSQAMQRLMAVIDCVSTVACLFFQDTPPAIKVASTIDSRVEMAGNRRNFAAGSAGNAGALPSHRASILLGHTTSGLQLDIERLFSERIVICNYEAIVRAPGHNSMVSTVSKVRCQCLSSLEHR